MKNKIIIVIVALIPLVYFEVVFPTLPEQVVIHWNIHGQADRFGSPFIYLTLAQIPLLTLLLYVVYIRFKPVSQNKKYLGQLIDGLVVFLAFISILFTSQATSEQLRFLNLLVIIFGILFVFMGNMMNKLNKNLVFGIRIPATIRSEKVWNRTHYIGGYGFVICGILTIISGIVFTNPEVSLGVMITLLLLLIVYITIYAEVLYRRETGHSSLSK